MSFSTTERGKPPSNPPEPVGICCFCGDECNPASQSCGVCPRRMWRDGTFARMWAENRAQEEPEEEKKDKNYISLSLSFDSE